MVELPLDDAASAYEKLAEELNGIRFSPTSDDMEGLVADQLRADGEGFNTFTSRTADVLADLAKVVRAQHEADERLRDNPATPAAVEEAAKLAAAYELKSKYVTAMSPLDMARAVQAQKDYEEIKRQREAAINAHTNAAAAHAPKLNMDAPPISVYTSTVCSPYTPGSGDRHAGNEVVGGSQTGGSGGSGAGSAGLPSAASPGAGGGSLGGGSVDASDIGTETSSDGLMGGGTGAAGQPMMGQPMQAQGQPQQPTMPSMAGTGAAGAGGMLGTPGGAGARNRKRDKTEPRTDLSGAGFVAGGLGGAAAGAAAAGVDRGVSVSGVNTKADTSGLGTNLSGAGGKPGGGGAPTPNMMRGGGMMGGPMMGGMGSGAGGGTKAKPDIKPLIKDRDLHGLDSIKDAIPGGNIGRDTAKPEDLTGVDQFLDPSKVKKD